MTSRDDTTQPFKRDAAAGGLVAELDSTGELRIVLIRSRRRKSSVWSLPKGHYKGSETAEQTALREVREETGLRTEIVSKLGTIDYWFIEKGVRYHKFVEYFVMTASGGDLADHDDEVEEARWISWDAAIVQMSYPNERELVEARREAVVAALREPKA
ncbi:MAG: NUDIX hydrolase [Blastocatellia bacterium]|nr:NUDIX hydrolase [Blastocatellia bacterium]